jgi:hypothetical protein
MPYADRQQGNYTESRNIHQQLATSSGLKLLEQFCLHGPQFRFLPLYCWERLPMWEIECRVCHNLQSLTFVSALWREFITPVPLSQSGGLRAPLQLVDQSGVRVEGRAGVFDDETRNNSVRGSSQAIGTSKLRGCLIVIQEMTTQS